MNKTLNAMEQLEAANPVSEDELHGWTLTNEGQRIFDGIVAERAIAPRTARVPRLPIRSIATASAVLLIVGFIATRPTETPPPAPEVAGTARDVLHGAALVAAQGATEAGPGQYIYRKFEGQGTGTRDVNGRQITALIPTSIEVWISADNGEGRVMGRTDGPRFLSAEDEAWWIAAGRPAFSDVGSFTKVLPDASQTRAEVKAYPTDVDDLYAHLRQRFEEMTACPQPKSGEAVECPPAGDPDMYVFTAASDLLLNYPDASAQLRSALFEVMAKLPGTVVDRDATDPSGRDGIAVSLVVGEDGGRSQRHEMYLDPETSEVLGFRDVFLEPDGSEATYAYSVLLRSGVVDEAGQRP